MRYAQIRTMSLINLCAEEGERLKFVVDLDSPDDIIISTK